MLFRLATMVSSDTPNFFFSPPICETRKVCGGKQSYGKSSPLNEKCLILPGLSQFFEVILNHGVFFLQDAKNHSQHEEIFEARQKKITFCRTDKKS
jgi:hypothetical protein